MKIQSLSISVPASCCNRCKFCVAHMHEDRVVNQIEKNIRFRDLYKTDYKKRLAFARDNGCNTVMLTGDGEPLLNRRFLEDFGEWNRALDHPFRWIEIQTGGGLLDDEYLRFLRNSVNVDTISLSLSSIFSSDENATYNCPVSDKYKIDIECVCSEIKRYDFNLRLSLNMTDFYDSRTPEQIFTRIRELGGNQVTFRVLYTSGKNTPEDKWIEQHACKKETMQAIEAHIKKAGSALEVLPFGAMKYSVDEISTVIDDDCMSQSRSGEDTVKYLILRPNCKLYSRWDDLGSLIF